MSTPFYFKLVVHIDRSNPDDPLVEALSTEYLASVSSHELGLDDCDLIDELQAQSAGIGKPPEIDGQVDGVHVVIGAGKVEYVRRWDMDVPDDDMEVHILEQHWRHVSSSYELEALAEECGVDLKDLVDAARQREEAVQVGWTRDLASIGKELDDGEKC